MFADENRAPSICWPDTDRVFALATMPGGHVITGGAPNGDITVYDGRTGALEATLSGHVDSVLSLIFVESKNQLYSTSADGTVRQWSAETLQNTMVYEGHNGFVVGLFFVQLDTDTGLFSGGDDRLVHQWNVASGACVHSFKGHRGPVNAIAGDNEHIYTGASDGMVKCWSIHTRRCVNTLRTAGDTVWHLLFLPSTSSAFGDAPRLICACADATIKIYTNPSSSGILTTELNGHSAKVRRVLACGPILFSASADQTVNVWNMDTGTMIESLHVHHKQVACLGLENNQLFTGGFDRLIARWDASDFLTTRQPHRPFTALSAVRAKELAMAKEKVDQITAARNRRRVHAGTATVDEVAALYKQIPINFIIQALDVKVQSSSLACDVLFYIPFLVMFCLMFLLARPIEDNYYVVRTIDAAIGQQQLPSFKTGRTMADINTVDWFSRWLELTVTEVFAHRDYANRSVFRGQNYLIGALRIRTQRAHRRSCKWNPAFIDSESLWNATLEDALRTANITAAGWGNGTTSPGGGPSTTSSAPLPPGELLSNLPCYGSMIPTPSIDKDPFFCSWNQAACPDNAYLLMDFLGVDATKGGFQYNAAMGISFTGQLQDYDAGGYGYDIHFNNTPEVALAKARALLALGFVDDFATRMVDVSFHVYNPALDLFVGVQVIFETPNGGSWVGILDRQTGYEVFRLRASGVLALEVFFFLFVIIFCVFFVKEAYDETKNGRVIGFWLSWWTLMELVNLGTFMVMYYFRWSWMVQGPKTDIAAVIHSAEYPALLQDALQLYQYQVWCNAINTILTFLKLLKFVRLNERLNVLTRTLDVAQQSLMGVILLFVYVVFAFAICGVVLYGTGLQGFRNLSASYVTLLRTLLGDGQYDDMSDEARLTTLTFYWAFMILCLFILLNFLVAVISDAFADVSQTSASIPLDVSIVKAFEDARFECLPRNIRNKLTLLRFRQTQTGIIKTILHELRVKRDSIVDEDAAKRHDYDEAEDFHYHKDDFVKLIPPDVKTVQTEDFIDEVWKDLAWEYYHLLQGSKSASDKEKDDAISQELSQALRPVLEAMPVVESVRQRLAIQEAKLRGFVHTLNATQNAARSTVSGSTFGNF